MQQLLDRGSSRYETTLGMYCLQLDGQL